MNLKEELYRKLHLLQQAIPNSNWEYYYLNSIDNFIYHLDGFASERTSQRLANKIDEYLNVVQEKAENDSRPEQTTKELFTKYIYPMADEYHFELGFTGKPYYPLTFTIAIIVFFILKFFYSFLFSILVVGIVLIVWIGRNLLKVKAKKVY